MFLKIYNFKCFLYLKTHSHRHHCTISTNLLLFVVLCVCKITAMFGDSPEGLTGLCIYTFILGCDLLRLKWYKVKSAKESGTWDKVQRKPGTNFQEFSPSGVAQDVFSSSSVELRQRGWNVDSQESSLETQCPVFLLGAAHWGTLFLVVPKFPIPWRNAEVQRPLHGLGTARHSSVLGMVGPLPKSVFPGTGQGSALHISLSKDRQSQACSANCFLHVCIHVALAQLNLVAWHC